MDDLKAAYRTVSQALRSVAIVSYFSFVKMATVFQFIPGHSFGCVGSVPNFSRVPRFFCMVALYLGLVLCTHYIDDIPCVDVEEGGMSAQQVIQVVMRACGWDIEPKKRLPMRCRNVFLGITVCLRRLLSHGYAVCMPKQEMIQEVLEALRKCKAEDRITPGEAASFRGKVGWLCTPLYGHVGRAATQPLMQRQAGADGSTWTPAMSDMLAFLSALCAPDIIPHLRVPMQVVRMAPVLVYTDASFHWLEGAPVAVLGMFVKDTAGGRMWAGSLLLPFWFYDFLSSNQKTYIMQAELVAAISAFFSLPDALAGRAIIYFVDNVFALSCLVHGYASKYDCARLVNCFHAQIVGLRAMTHGEWVPSKANPADIPTRVERDGEMPTGVEWVVMVLPPILAIEGDPAEWIRSVRRNTDRRREPE